MNTIYNSLHNGYPDIKQLLNYAVVLEIFLNDVSQAVIGFKTREDYMAACEGIKIMIASLSYNP